MNTMNTQQKSPRNTALQSFLDINNARELKRYPGSPSLTLYTVQGVVFVVQRWKESDGFEIYAPVCASNSIVDTFSALRKMFAGTEDAAD